MTQPLVRVVQIDSDELGLRIRTEIQTNVKVDDISDVIAGSPIPFGYILEFGGSPKRWRAVQNSGSLGDTNVSGASIGDFLYFAGSPGGWTSTDTVRFETNRIVINTLSTRGSPIVTGSPNQTSLEISSARPGIRLEDTDGDADEKNWRFVVYGGDLVGEMRSDSGTTSNRWFEIIRNGILSSEWSLFVGAEETAIRAIDGGAVQLYHNNVDVVETTTAAAGGLNVNNTLTGGGLERVLTISDLGTGSPADQLHVIAGDGITVTTGSPDVTIAVDSTVARLAGSPITTINSDSFAVNQSLRVYGSPITQYTTFDMGADLVATSTGNLQFFAGGTVESNEILRLTANSSVSIRNGRSLIINDIGDTDSIAIRHDSTDINVTATNTTNFEFIGFAGDLYLRDGMGLIIFDSGDTDFVEFRHDGTDFNTDFTNTTDWNIGGATGEIRINDGIDLRVRDGGLFVVNKTDNSSAALIVTPGAGATNATNITTGGSGNLNISSGGGAGDVQIVNGSAFEVFDAGNTDSARFSHNGTNFSFEFVNTDALLIRDGVETRFYDSSDTDYAAFSHDGTDFRTDFINTTDWEIAGLRQLRLFSQAGSPNNFGLMTVDTTAWHFEVAGTDLKDIEFLPQSGRSVKILSGRDLRVQDSGDTDYASFSHDGSDFLLNCVNTSSFKITGTSAMWQDGNFFVRGGGSLRIYDSGNTDFAEFDHNGTDFLNDFTNTAWWRIAGLTQGLMIRDGASVRIQDSGNTDYLNMSHDGTDFTFDFVNTTGADFTNAGNYTFDSNATITDGQFSITRTSGSPTAAVIHQRWTESTSANFVQAIMNDAFWIIRPGPGGVQDVTHDFLFDFNNDRWQFDRDIRFQNGPITGGTNLNFDMNNPTFTNAMTIQDTEGAAVLRLEANNGSLHTMYSYFTTVDAFEMRPDNNTAISFGHQYGSPLPSGNWYSAADFQVRGGQELQILDSTLADSAAFSHDGTDFNTDFTNTTDWNLNDGVQLKLWDSGGTDFAALLVSGDSFNIDGTGLTSMKLRPTGTENGIVINADGSVVLYYDNTETLQTSVNRTESINAISGDGAMERVLTVADLEAGQPRMRYIFDDTTTASDPGSGTLRYDNATPASVTNLYIDDISNEGLTSQLVLDNLAAGDIITICSEADNADYLVASVSGPPVDNTGWWTVPVTVINSGSLPASLSDILNVSIQWFSHLDLIEVVTTTNVITAPESGTTYYLNTAGGFTSTLPAPAAGLRYRFVVSTAPTTAYIITTNGGANILYGTINEITTTAGISVQAQDTLNFVANTALIGDWIEFESDGTNWYVHGITQVDNGITASVT